jgi:predicted PhzF superfamily epimerase YddE/YHI9
MAIPILHIDAFTDQPFGGNPAAVCLLDGPADEAWMQNVAMEMNLSETAFVHPISEGWSLRWFTPVLEVDLCGHATLASAHALWEMRRLGLEEPARFHTRSGLLTCARSGGFIEMDFPAKPAVVQEPPDGLLESLGLVDAVVARSNFDYLVELPSERDLRELKPDFGQLKRVQSRGTIVTAQSTGRFDFVSRFFAPLGGIDEDPVTGSAHCTLGPWWGDKLGKDELVGFQASRRGGVVRVQVRGERVMLRGQAVATARGELLC